MNIMLNCNQNIDCLRIRKDKTRIWYITEGSVSPSKEGKYKMIKLMRLGIANLLFFSILSFNLIPAYSLSVRNGINCTKVGATTKVGSKIYQCGKNPYFRPKTLTWTLRGCMTANALLKDARSQYEDWKDLAKLAGADGEKTLQDLQTSISELETMMKNEVCKKGA